MSKSYEIATTFCAAAAQKIMSGAINSAYNLINISVGFASEHMCNLPVQHKSSNFLAEDARLVHDHTWH
jgi:Na+/H+ antiporter NhaD/arsenite permease-like protein